MVNDKYKGYIALDLGTTNSVISYIQPDGEITLIKNDDGDYLTPSFIWFNVEITDGENTKVGKQAKEKMNTDPTNVLCGYKPYMGLGKPLKNLRAPNGNPITMKAETCSKLALKYIKRCAERQTGEPIDNIVVTVPARFTDPQRNATHNCCTAVGLNVLKIISEPTAAAYHYGINSIGNDDIRTILAYDLGGGTFDASVIVNTGTEETTVAGTEGDIHLGGDDIDKDFAALIATKVLPKGAKYSALCDDCKEIFTRLAEKAKVALCEMYTEVEKLTEVDDKKVTHRVDLTVLGAHKEAYDITRDTVTVTYADFKKTAKPFIVRTLTLTTKLLDDLKKSNTSQPEDITDVLLIGGSSRIPLVREMLIELFEERGIGDGRFNVDYFSKYLADPDLSVSMGAAAYMKAILDGEEYKIMDIVPLPIGIAVTDAQSGQRRMEVIINRGSLLPARATHPQEFTNLNAGDEYVVIEIYEGSSLNLRENTKLGLMEVPLNAIQMTEAKSARIKITVEVTSDGIIKLSYTDIVNARKGKLELSRETDTEDTNTDASVDSGSSGRIGAVIF